jgi:hypothetical protein
MIFDIKPKKRGKQYGDIKDVTKFALFPKKIGNQRIWLERYIVTKVWTEQGSNRVAYDGMFVRSYYDGWKIKDIRLYNAL